MVILWLVGAIWRLTLSMRPFVGLPGTLTQLSKILYSAAGGDNLDFRKYLVQPLLKHTRSTSKTG